MNEVEEQKKYENEGSYGYFTILAVKFTSSEQQIDRNFNTLTKFYTDKDQFQGNSQDEIKKINEAYRVIKNENEREDYMHKLMIRCYLSQPFEMQQPNKQNNQLFWPFFIFEIIKEGKNTSDIMQFNFVAQTLTEQKKDKRTKSYVFSNISSALFSKKDDEFIVNFIENGKILSQNYKAKFQNQRDQIVRLAIYAKEIFEETKPTLEFHNPNTKQDLNLFKVQHYAIGENSKAVSSKVTNLFFDQVSTRNNFLWNDSYIPPHSLLKTSAQKVALRNSNTIYFTIGKSQMLVSRDDELKKIIQVIPLKKEYLAFSREDNIVQLQVLNNTRKYKFHDKQSASQFVQKLMSVQNQKALAAPLITSYPFGSQLQNVARQKKTQIQKLNNQIVQFETKLQQLKIQRQQLLSEYNDLDFDKADDDELIINKDCQRQQSPEPASLFKAPVRYQNE